MNSFFRDMASINEYTYTEWLPCYLSLQKLIDLFSCNSMTLMQEVCESSDDGSSAGSAFLVGLLFEALMRSRQLMDRLLSKFFL